MARAEHERHTAAFVVGALLGGAAGAAATLWRAPRSGVQTRIMIAERVEGTLFRLMGMDRWNPVTSSYTAERPTTPVEEPRPAAPVTVKEGVASAESPATAPTVTVEEERLPPTFRGLPLSEQPTDLVIDGPRPAPAERG